MEELYSETEVEVLNSSGKYHVNNGHSKIIKLMFLSSNIELLSLVLVDAYHVEEFNPDNFLF